RDALRCRVVGFVFQFYHLLPELTLLENVLLPRMVDASIGGWPARRGAARAQAEQVIGEVGLSHRLRHRPRELSGGERQRAAIARAMVNRPKLLLADEPTGNLDGKTGRGVLEVLSRLNAEGQTIILVTHDHQTASFAHRVCQLEDGRIQPC
ncbi:MAG: ATP-binding cassette domain-containing protein, partial [Phycisphaerales bacterium]|nr:ATP-binding cassette domain-containing protein [Phycisphaerales bacterium]